MRRLKTLALAILAVMVCSSNLVLADLVQIGRVDLHGTGFGAETYILSMHATGTKKKTDEEQGCVGWIGGAITVGSSACGQLDVPPGEESGSGSYTGGDEMPPTHFPHQQTPLLSDLGVSDGRQLVIIFNPDQEGPDHPITLADLTVTIWSDSLGTLVWQSGDLASDGDFFASTDAGIGKSGIAYGLDDTQAADLTAFIGSHGGPGSLRLGLSAWVTGADGGPDAFFVTTRSAPPPPPPPPPPPVPEPSSVVLLSSGLLIAFAKLRKRLMRA